MIYLFRNEQQEGPYTQDALAGMLSSGEITSQDFAWYEGCTEWIPVGSIPGLVAKTPPPPPGAASVKVEKKTEETLWEGHPSLIAFAGQILISVLLIPFFGAGFILFLLIWISWKKTHYTVTSKRLIERKGFINRATNEVMIKDVRSVTVLRKGFDFLFGLASIEFSSSATDRADITFFSIHGAEKIRAIVNDLRG